MPRRTLAVVVTALAAAVLGACAASDREGERASVHGADAERPLPDDRRALVAAFGAASYRPGARARLVVWSRVRRVSVQLFRFGAAPVRPLRRHQLRGTPVSRARVLARSNGRGRWSIDVTIPKGPSGLYYARLRAPRGKEGYALFVLRSPRPTSRVLVVLPTYTWQAYNFRDVDRDGVGDTWYADPRIRSVDLARPFENRGVPRHFRGYDSGFLRWLVLTGNAPDFATDEDLASFEADTLERRYDLVVFPGHEEYVTEHAFALVSRYRDLGGNLAFLSANNFFYRVERRGTQIVRLGRWRDLGRSEAALLGVQFVGCCEAAPRPYVVVGAHLARWLFRGTGLRNGDRLGHYGIEIDQAHRDSPPGTRVLARIPNAFGHGRSAEMTYYETRRGAKVFAAGVLNFGGSALQPNVSQLLENLWTRLSRP